MQNLPRAAFSLANYVFDKLSIDLTEVSGKELAISFETNGVLRKDDSSYKLVFNVRVFSKNVSRPFIELRCTSTFKFQEMIEMDSIPDFFYNNSIAILFPYVRAYLSLVTTQANIPGIILQTLNLSSLGGELKKNTTQE